VHGVGGIPAELLGVGKTFSSLSIETVGVGLLLFCLAVLSTIPSHPFAWHLNSSSEIDPSKEAETDLSAASSSAYDFSWEVILTQLLISCVSRKQPMHTSPSKKFELYLHILLQGVDFTLG
jgi:hypothetical protein